MATGTTARTPAPAVRTGTTRRRTRTGTLVCAPPVTTNRNTCTTAATAPVVDLQFCGQPVAAGFGKHTSRSGERRVGETRKPCRHFAVGKKHKHLFARVVDRDNLWAAYRKASLGKRNSLGYLEFRQNEAANIALLERRLIDGSYRPGEPRQFMVFEPKARQISALPFVDRVAQHALCNIIEPIFDRVFLPQSYACRKCKGTHAAARQVQSMLRKTPEAWVLKTDFSKYFASIDRAVLHREFRRKLSCAKTLALLEAFIPADGIGLPIGNLTSQLGANLYGHMVDRWLCHVVGISSFVRYMDDVVVVGRSREAMHLLQVLMESHAKNAMRLRFSRWSVQPSAAGVNFCGYRIWPTHKLLRRSSVQRARRKLASFARSGDFVAKSQFLGAWLGHARHANMHHLLAHLGVEK